MSIRSYLERHVSLSANTTSKILRKRLATSITKKLGTLKSKLRSFAQKMLCRMRSDRVVQCPYKITVRSFTKEHLWNLMKDYVEIIETNDLLTGLYMYDSMFNRTNFNKPNKIEHCIMAIHIFLTVFESGKENAMKTRAYIRFDNGLEIKNFSLHKIWEGLCNCFFAIFLEKSWPKIEDAKILNRSAYPQDFSS